MDLAEAIRILCADVLPALAKTEHRHAEALSVLLAYVEAKCIHPDCPNEARTRVFWPGRAPARMCPFHSQAAMTVASCLGVPLHVESVQ
jgi:hypothetical protein